MFDTLMILVFVTVACIAGSVALWRLSRWFEKQGGRPSFPRGFEIVCEHCDNALAPAVAELVTLKGSDVALAVRAAPSVQGLTLYEYVCPHCEAVHCFASRGQRLEWIGVNLWDTQQKSAHCYECHGAVARPDWPRGAYDGRLNEIPDVPENLGLVCGKCQAMCCLACCRRFTRGRTADGEYLCPRCARPPMNRVFHPG